MKKINHLFKIIGIKDSFKLPPDDLYQDYGFLEDYLSFELHIIQERLQEVQKNLKGSQVVTLDANDMEDNLEELKKYPQYNLKEKDFRITNKKLIDRNDVFDYYKGKFTKNDQKVTILKMRDTTNFKRLLTVLTLIKHPYVESFKGAHINNSQIQIVTNRDGEKLSNLLYLSQEGDQLSIEKGDKTILAFKTAQAMSYLHSRSVIHRNLSTSNIYVTKSVTKDGQIEIKPTVAGFRHSRLIPGEISSKMTNLRIDGKVPVSYFRAPELNDGQYDEKVDVFAFAGILYELLEGYPPFRDKLKHEVATLLSQNERPILPKNTPQPLRDLITKCWDQIPGRRPSFDQITKEMCEKKIIFPSDQENVASISEFYDKKSVKSITTKKCIDAFELIKSFIGKASQFRFELLRARTVLNSYQFLLGTPSFSLKKLSEEEKELDESILDEKVNISLDEIKKLESLYNNLIGFQSIVFKMSSNEINETINLYFDALMPSLVKRSPKKLPVFDPVKIPSMITDAMDRIYESMTNFGFKNIQRYVQCADDLVFDLRELICLLEECKCDENSPSIFCKQIADIEEFKRKNNLDQRLSEELFNTRLKDLFSPFAKFELKRANYDISFSDDSPSGVTAKVHF